MTACFLAQNTVSEIFLPMGHKTEFTATFAPPNPPEMSYDTKRLTFEGHRALGAHSKNAFAITRLFITARAR